MPAKHRPNDMPFTCSNSRYRTDVEKGEPHLPAAVRGSVFKEPLAKSDNGSTLWLEYVIDTKYGDKRFWLMWYDRNGKHNVSMSSVITADDVKLMASRLTNFINLEDQSA